MLAIDNRSSGKIGCHEYLQLLAKFRQVVATNELVLYDRFVSDDFPPIETREITAFHRSSLSLKWCELRNKHIFPKPEKSLDIKCWLIAARGIKEAGKKLDALHLPSDPIADFFLQRGEKLVDVFNARVLRAVHGDKKEANFLERVAEAVSGTFLMGSWISSRQPSWFTQRSTIDEDTRRPRMNFARRRRRGGKKPSAIAHGATSSAR